VSSGTTWFDQPIVKHSVTTCSSPVGCLLSQLLKNYDHLLRRQIDSSVFVGKRQFISDVYSLSGHAARRLRRIGRLPPQLLCQSSRRSCVFCCLRSHGPVCTRQRRRRCPHEAPWGGKNQGQFAPESVTF